MGMGTNGNKILFPFVTKFSLSRSEKIFVWKYEV